MKGDKDENLNVRSAFLHVIGDLLGSVGAIAAALLIMFFGWQLADPIASVIVAVLIIISGWRVAKDSLHILMEGVPVHIDVEEVKRALLALRDVQDVHDLHVWAITSDFPALSCHLIVSKEADYPLILQQAQHKLNHEFHIEHTTIQLDREDGFCKGDHCN